MPKSTKEVRCGTCPYFEFIPEHSAAQAEFGDGPCYRFPGKVRNDDFVMVEHVCGEHPKFKDLPAIAGLWPGNESHADTDKDLHKTDPA